jgi:PTH1 family peptidyl-tRNA hydrolase
MNLLVGLGNPGRRYQTTRHNLGFQVLDRLASSLDLTWTTSERDQAMIARMPGLLLVKPLTFMNLSGDAVAPLLRRARLKPDHLWVVSDDVDLALGKIRVRHTGSAGGHNGLASIIERLGSPDFHRLRIGIGSNRDSGEPAESYVLKPFAPDERPVIATAIAEAVALLERELIEKRKQE